jgi:ubiquinone/menaquinone biosynthesis C-methylase UbiE
MTLISVLKIYRAKNILEIACGTGLLLPLALAMKNKEAQYVATDLSPEMIKKTEKRLQSQLELFKSS